MKEKNNSFWIEIKIDSPVFLADSIANFLIELTGQGILLEDIKDSKDNALVRITGYFSSEQSKAGLIDKFYQYISNLETIFEEVKFKVKTRILPEENWLRSWQQYFKPHKVTKRLVIKPSWELYVPKKEEIIVEIDPGMAFGTGHHPSTYLVLQRLEMLFEEVFWPKGFGPLVLDIGTGTGILAIAAAKFGAKKVIAIDIDAQAVKIAKQNVYRNAVENKISVFLSPVSELNEHFDLIMANISAYELKRLAKDISILLGKKAHLILSGFLKEELDDLLKVYTSLGLKLVYKEIDQEFEEWMVIDFQNT